MKRIYKMMFSTHTISEEVTSLNVIGVRLDKPTATTNVIIHTMMNGMMNNASTLIGLAVVFKFLSCMIVVLSVSK
jgi:hypothetical protein